MSGRIVPEISFALLLLILSFNKGYSQVERSQPVRIMFYNVENFFDIYDDSITDDNGFLPDGLMRWNLDRYNKKTNSLYKTILAAGEWEPPAIIAFCEIENRKVLEDLIFGTYLSKYNYSIIHEESPDRRGIDVCLIYRKKLANVILYRYWIPKDITRKEFNSRSVLYTKILIGSDTIHLIVNHWPSRRGGVLAGENYRQRIASMVREKVDSLFELTRSEARIIILGDFNSTPDDEAIKSLVWSADTCKELINMSERLDNNGSGTYRYNGTWEMIDQVIVSRKLLVCREGLCTEPNMIKIFKPDFLLKKDPKYPGKSPFSTYRGYKYQGGFSDHLPVLIDLKFRSDRPE
jgi:endonuclease/exonuclease/phosphatase family metal-dependent hydrolase